MADKHKRPGPCTYAFFVDGVPVHCTGEHSYGNLPQGQVMHRLPALSLNAATLIETYGQLDHCAYCEEIPVNG